MTRYAPQNKRFALNERSLRDLALGYAGRYASSREKLARYLRRKLRERGWEGQESADIDAITADFVRLGYVDDKGYALMKGAAATRRGLGERRIRAALSADGIGESDQTAALDQAAGNVWEAAEILARKKKIGPYAMELADRTLREKHIAVFLRAGHDIATARVWAEAQPGEFPERSE
jgi:regulatory protein